MLPIFIKAPELSVFSLLDGLRDGSKSDPLFSAERVNSCQNEKHSQIFQNTQKCRKQTCEILKFLSRKLKILTENFLLISSIEAEIRSDAIFDSRFRISSLRRFFLIHCREVDHLSHTSQKRRILARA